MNMEFTSCQLMTYVVKYPSMDFSRRSEEGHSGPILVSGGCEVSREGCLKKEWRHYDF